MRTRYALALIVLACGGSNSAESAPDICPDTLPPGIYALRKTPAKGSPSACPMIADEAVPVQSDNGPPMTNPPPGCVDTPVDTENCINSFRRQCQVSICSLQYVFTIDRHDWTGLLSYAGTCSDGSSAACSYDLTIVKQ